ncbi:MAG: PD40 domain-containing protein, partial [Calditrichaeota bacterium]|nr:PD40 domain-containing protein [Calditrichota bacterium]
PLEPGRNLKFTATEGSWISLDVSPDGKTIVFDLLGDLYTLPITGGAATRITHGMAFDAQPRFSPDGKELVFVSDSSGADNVWLYEFKDKELKALTKGESDSYFSPEWTPDGKYIVVSKGSGLFATAKLAIMHKDGGSGTGLITKPNPLKTMGAAFGNDPRYIWYAQRNGDWQYNAVMPQYQIARYDRETGKSETMTSRYGSAMRPALSPDGKYLVYASRYEQETGLVIRTLSTGEENWLAYPVQRDDQEARATLDAFPGYSFTPDSKAIVVSYGGKIWKVGIDGKTVAEIPFKVDVNIDLGPEVRFDYQIEDDPQFTVRQIRHPAISPDGKKVAFTAMDKLWVMDLKTQKPQRLTESKMGEHYPAWSPDGRWIAFTSWIDNNGGHIYKVRSNGGDPEQLSKTAALYTETAWSPDGKRIVAIKAAARDLRESTGYFGGGLAREIVYVPEDGGQERVISAAEDRSNPHFTMDNSRIYLFSNSKGLVSIRWDGTDERAHVKVTGVQLAGQQNPANPDFITMAPKGDQALVQIVNHLYTVTVPITGGDTPTISINSPESAAFPSRKLTEIGGEFPSWSKDANKVFWSIGNALNTYDLVAAKAFEDSVKLAEKKKKEEEKAAKSDSTKTEKKEEKDDKNKKKKYEADVMRIIIKMKRDIPKGVVVLSGARAITMNGKEIIENADIVINGNKIQAIGKAGSVQIPSGAERIDVSGKTILPGYVDTHYHPQWLIPDMHTTQVWQFLATLAYGVTTTRDPQTATTDILSYFDMVEAGNMIGPRTYSTGPGVFWSEPVKDLDHAKSILKRYSEYYDTKTFKMYMSGNRKQRQYLIMAAKELKLMPTTEGGLDYKLNLTHA